MQICVLVGVAFIDNLFALVETCKIQANITFLRKCGIYDTEAEQSLKRYISEKHVTRVAHVTNDALWNRTC